MTQTPKAVFFDLDDTLFDHRHSLQQGIAAVHAAYPSLHHVSCADLTATYLSLIEHWHHQVMVGMLTLEGARRERFRDVFARYGQQITVDDALGAAAIYRTAYQQTRQLVPGARALVEALRADGVCIAIITNSEVKEQHDKLRHLEMLRLIDVLIISEEVGVPKPQPQIFETALARTRCAPNEVVMVGDAWLNDIVGATNVGIRAVWLNRFGDVCPNAALAREITALEPCEHVLALLLYG
jgi:putative hydrolase of the HAD superfamily